MADSEEGETIEPRSWRGGGGGGEVRDGNVKRGKHAS